MNEYKSSEPIYAPTYEYDHTTCRWDSYNNRLEKMKMPEGTGWELLFVQPHVEGGLHYVWRRVIG